MDWLTSSKFDTFDRPGDLIDEYWRTKYGIEAGCPYHKKVVVPLTGQGQSGARPKTPKLQPKKKKKLDLDPVKYQSLLIKSRNEMAKNKDKELRGCGIERWPEAAQEAADANLAWRRPLARPRTSVSPKRPTTAKGMYDEYLKNSPTVAALLENFKEKGKSPGSSRYEDNLTEMYNAMMLASSDPRRAEESYGEMQKSQQLVDRILSQVFSGEAPSSPKPSLARPATAADPRGGSSDNVQFILNNDEESLAGVPGSFLGDVGVARREMKGASGRGGHGRSTKEVLVRGSAFPYRQKGWEQARSGPEARAAARAPRGRAPRRLLSEVQTSRVAAGEGGREQGTGVYDGKDDAVETPEVCAGGSDGEAPGGVPEPQPEVEATAPIVLAEAGGAAQTPPRRSPLLFSPGMLASTKGKLKQRGDVVRCDAQEPTEEMKQQEQQRRRDAWQRLCELIDRLGVGVEAADFDVGALLGRGKFAGVYRGAHRARGELVALKVAQFSGHLDPSDWADMASRDDYAAHLPAACAAEYSREVAALAAVGAHEHIVSMAGACARPLLIALEFVNGDNLPAFLEENEWRLKPKMLVKILYDISAGLSFMHSRGFVHRDVKSHNVMVAVRGASFCAKVCDLGAAAFVGEGDLVGLCGTLGYTAPEVYAGSPYSQAVDVFSFAVIGWEIFDRHGDNPMTNTAGADGEAALLDKLRGGMRPLLGAAHPSSVREIVQACWQTEPSQRPAMLKVANILSEMVTDPALFTRVIDDYNHVLDRLYGLPPGDSPLLNSEGAFEALKSRSTGLVKKLSSQELIAIRRGLSTAARSNMQETV